MLGFRWCLDCVEEILSKRASLRDATFDYNSYARSFDTGKTIDGQFANSENLQTGAAAGRPPL